MKNPPRDYLDFVERYPALGEAWDLTRRAEEDGPLDERTRRLIKVAIGVGAGRSIGSSTRKALRAGIPVEELEQIVALAASTIGFPGTVAAFQAVHKAAEKGSE